MQMLEADITQVDRYFMGCAFRQALKGYDKQEVPVGCVLVWKNKIIGQDHNRVEQLKDPTAHAEMIAITQASDYRQSWRLNEVILYTTLIPCLMCLGAIQAARIERVVYGATDPKMIGTDFCCDLTKHDSFFSKTVFCSGVMAKESSELLKNFFQKLRKRKKNEL